MDIAAEGPKSSFWRAMRIVVLLSGFPLAGSVTLAVIPSMTQMAAHFSEGLEGTFLFRLMLALFGVKMDGAFAAQLIMVIPAATQAFGAPLIGWLAGRMNKRLLLLVSALTYALAGAGGAVAPDLMTMLLLRLILGLASSGISTIGLSLVADYYQGETRDKLIGFAVVAGVSGSFICASIAGPIAQYGGWQAPFLIYLVGLVVFGLALVTITEPKRVSVAVAEPAKMTVAAWGICLLIVVLSLIGVTLVSDGMFLLATEGLGSPTVQTLIVDMTIVGGIVAGLAFGFLRPRVGFLGVLALIWLALLIGTWGFGWAQGIVLIAATAFFAGAATGLTQPLATSSVVNAVSPEAASKAIGFALGSIFLGILLHPFVVAPMRAAGGVMGPFIWMGAFALAGLAVTILFQIKGVFRRPALSS